MDKKFGYLKKIRENFRSFEDIWLFCQVLILVTTLPIMLRVLSLPKLMKFFTPRSIKVYERLEIEKLKYKLIKFTDYVLSRKYLMCKNTCLRRSLVLYHFLCKFGIDVTLCIGVRYKEMQLASSSQKELEGHAWLVNNGDIFLEKNEEITKSYKITYCYP